MAWNGTYELSEAPTVELVEWLFNNVQNIPYHCDDTDEDVAIVASKREKAQDFVLFQRVSKELCEMQIDNILSEICTRAGYKIRETDGGLAPVAEWLMNQGRN